MEDEFSVNRRFVNLDRLSACIARWHCFCNLSFMTRGWRVVSYCDFLFFFLRDIGTSRLERF